ncbi:hypothetical protein [Micromonospora sp. NPDC005806]|uniref:hypothetical protein n=1 Tax=Micromonospora sp. NPDC005806 TaxID=3364234 RepID=UPI0036B4DF2F
MSQPQPAGDRPADGGTPATGQDRDPEVNDPPVPSPGHVPAPSTAASDAGIPPTPDPQPASPDIPTVTAPDAEAPPEADIPTVTTPDAEAPPEADTPTAPAPEAEEPTQPDTEPAPPSTSAGATADTDATPAAPVSPARGTAAVPASGAADSAPVPGRPDPTRVETRPEPPAPRWSGSAPVPPPPPRKRSWGESAEPTPVPPPDVPEHQIPVDPWEGVDTTGWNLHSTDFPALPPTLDYPVPPHTLPYPVPPVGPPPPIARPVSPPPAPVSPTRPGPVPPPPPAPPAPARPPRQRRRESAPPPVTAPPGWRPPKGYVAVPVRRRRRWPWVLLLTVACCCGLPLWWAQPLSAQYPASAALPDRMHGLRLREDERSQATAEKLKTEMAQAHLLAEDTFAGIYSTDDGKRVTLFGGTGFRLTPEADADAEIARLTEQYALDAAVPVETRVRGRYERCAVGRADGDGVVVCTSVDHGSLTTGIFTRLSLDDSGRLLDTLRQQVVTPKQS